MSLQDMRDALDSLEALDVPPVDDTAGQRALRAQVIAALAPTGITAAQAAPAMAGEPAGEPIVVIAWAVDYDDALFLHAVADSQITPALEQALTDVHRCWANRMDCTPEGWAAALRLIAALDAEEIDDGELEEDGMPSAEELAALRKAWDGAFVLGSHNPDYVRAGALDHPIRRIVVVNRAM